MDTIMFQATYPIERAILFGTYVVRLSKNNLLPDK